MISLLGYGMSKKLELQSNNALLIEDELILIDSNYIFIVFEVENEISTDLPIDQAIISILSQHQISLYEHENFNYNDLESIINKPKQKDVLLHCVQENKRIIQAIQAIKDNDCIKLGYLMNDSYYSFKSYIESLNQKYEYLWVLSEMSGHIGATFAGKYFIAFVEESKAKTYKDSLSNIFKKKYNQDLKEVSI